MLSGPTKQFTLMSSDPELRKAQHDGETLRNKLETLVIQVQKFLLAMKRLQRAVHHLSLIHI